MKPNHFTVLRFGLAVLTVLIYVLQPYLPKRAMQIHPLATTSIAINGHSDSETGDSTQWINESHSEWRCDYRSEYGYEKACGFSLSWGVAFEEDVSDEQSTPVCVSADSDDDGDGWGWENEQSCVVSPSEQTNTERVRDTAHVEPEFPECVSGESDDDGDGWGWENEQSCRVVEQAQSQGDTVAEIDEIPVCESASSDDDGDGWGWENEQSCRIVEQAQNQGNVAAEIDETPVCESASSDDDGDGWGWENERSCRVEESTSVSQQVKTVNFSKFDEIRIKVNYEGRAKNLRLYVRNYNAAYSILGNPDSHKYMSVLVPTEDLKVGAVSIGLDEFKVTDWWVNELDAPRELAGTELDAIVVLGLDVLEFGVHTVRIDDITLYGEWITREGILSALIVCWILYLLLEVVLRYSALREASLESEGKIDELTTIAKQLKEEKDTLQSLSTIDPLTGILNRTGLLTELHNQFPSGDLEGAGVLMLDIDHFKRINDLHGHDVGDDILKKFAEVVSDVIRSKDMFARWGGEEFLVVCPNFVSYKLTNLAEKIRVAVEAHVFVSEKNIPVTISIGATNFRKNEKLEAAFKRADVALYKAKDGRNRVEFEI